MVKSVLRGVGRPGLEPGTNALKGRRKYKICHRSRYAAVVLAQSGYPAGSLEGKSRSRSTLTLGRFRQVTLNQLIQRFVPETSMRRNGRRKGLKIRVFAISVLCAAYQI